MGDKKPTRGLESELRAGPVCRADAPVIPAVNLLQNGRSMSAAPIGAKPPFTAIKWLICIISSIGFAFDIYALLLAQYVVPPALRELRGIQPGSPEFAALVWVALLCPRRLPEASSVSGGAT